MKKYILPLLFVMSAMEFAIAEMEPATPESQGVSSQAILDWINACEKTFDAKKQGMEYGALHGFVIVRHGKVIAEGSWKPFDTLNETHMLYSHSKSFTSSAIGFLVDEGKLDLDERVADLFPGDMPSDPDPKMLEMRVRDLLTMNVGSDLNHDCPKHPDWCKAFLARKLDRHPGTGFVYDSDATYMLAAIVEKKSGKRLMDFLKEKMFDKIGITKAWSNTSPQGIACGGWGMNMTTRELARFGQLYLQKGCWEGKRILSPSWINLATTRHTWSGWQKVGSQQLGVGTDWELGYCFQFWKCPFNCYRADGAFGQYTVVMRDQDAVVSIHAGLGDMPKELNLIWEHLLPAMKKDALPENPAALKALRDKTAALAIAPIEGEATADGEEQLMCDYEFEQNCRGVKALRLMKDGKGWKIKLHVRCFPAECQVGYGEWKKGSLNFDCDDFEGLGTLRWSQPTACSAAFQKDGKLKMRIYLTGAPHTIELSFFLKDGVPTVEGELWGMNWTPLKGKRLEEPSVPKLQGRLPMRASAEGIRKFFEDNEFGVRSVERPADLKFDVISEKECLGGKAIHKTVKISTSGKFAPFEFVAHAYLPKNVEKAPAMVAINLGQRLASQKFDANAEDPSTKSWPIKDVIDRGVATIGFNNWDVANDGGDCFKTGVFKAFGPEKREANSWGALSAWAWGASRCADWIETQANIDAKRIGVIGHSRGGKTALWAGVTDPRFSLVCVNNSGCGGAKLNCMNLPWAETVESIYNTFPHWFAANYRNFAKDNGASQKFDQDELLKLVLPRKLVIGSGTQDDWAGPKGEEQAAKNAGAIHFYRQGPHDLTPYDWSKYLDNL